MSMLAASHPASESWHNACPTVNVSQRARIAWRARISRFQTAPARLLDISPQGARLVTSVPLHIGEGILFGMQCLPWEWVGATVLSVGCDCGETSYYLAFREPCPAGLLEATTLEPIRSVTEYCPSFSFEGDD
jgi:hypothetical protein